jgi:soluble cytochrome b562
LIGLWLFICIDEAKEAAGKGNLNDEAAALDKLQWWRDKGAYTGLSREVKAKGVGAGLSATVPFDFQLFGDLQDRKLSREYQDADGKWQRGRAQKTAEDKLSNPAKYLYENLPTALVSGGVGAAIGSKFGGKSNADEATALLNPPSPERLNTMAQQKIAAIKAQQAVQAAQKGAGPASHPALEQANLQAEFKKGLDRLDKGKPFAPKGNFMRGAPQEAKDRVRTGGDTFDLNAANVDPNNIARARKAQANKNLLLGLGATGATGYSALLAQRLAEMEENKLQDQ